MIAAIRSEFRKLLTVRSTYLIVLASLVLVALFAGFGDGFKAIPASFHNQDLLASESRNAAMVIGLVLAFAGLLLLGHEYRYNTIMYTLTTTNRRLKSLFAKLFVVSIFALVTGLLMVFFAPLCTIIGLHFSTPASHGFTLVPQTFDYWSVIWHCLFCIWGYAAYAFILIAILRSQVGAIVTFLLIPLIGENILNSLIKDNTKYLPFTSLRGVVDPTASHVNGMTAEHSAIIVLVYVGIGLVISAVLFVRRDAN